MLKFTDKKLFTNLCSKILLNISSSCPMSVSMAYLGTYIPVNLRPFKISVIGAQWLSGRMLDSRPRGLRVQASPASLHCVLEQEH